MKKRPWLIAVLLMLALLIAATAAFELAVHRLRSGILQALGPRASVEAIELGWTAVELRQLRVRADRSRWPAEFELSAERVRVVPELSSAWRGVWRVRSVAIEGAYVSVLRSRDGRVHLLPALLHPQSQPQRASATVGAKPGATNGATAGAAPSVHIQQIRLRSGVIEFFDASVRRVPHRIRLERLDAEIRHLALPALDRAVLLDLKGSVKGPQRDGTLAIRGQVTPATRDAVVGARLAGVDLLALQPYLLRLNEGGVRRGTLDLKIDATVSNNRLRAPGQLTLAGLQLGHGNGVVSTFAGVPAQAIVAAMGRNGRLELNFMLDGQLDDPQVSLNELFASRIAASLADTLDVGVRGVVQGMQGVIKGLMGR